MVEDRTGRVEGTLWLTIFDGKSAPYMVDLYDFGKNEITLGRADGNDIVLTSSIVSSQHAKFILDGSAIVLYDCQSTNGLYVENERISSVHLQTGNIIRTTGGRGWILTTDSRYRWGAGNTAISVWITVMCQRTIFSSVRHRMDIC